MLMKGQTEAVTLVLVTGIIIGLVGTAYLWGAPLIDKRTSTIDVDIGKDFINRLDDAIVEVANRGAGEKTLDIPIGFLTVYTNDTDNTDNNSLVLELPINQQMLFPDTIVYLGNSRDEVGIYGEVEPNILTMTGHSSGNLHLVYIRSRYRELDTDTMTPQRGFKIALNDGKEVLKGTSQVTVSFDRTETIIGGAKNNGNLIVTHVNVVVY